MKYWRYGRSPDDFECAGIFGDYLGCFETLEDAKGKPRKGDYAFVLEVRDDKPYATHTWLDTKWAKERTKKAQL